MPAWDHPPDLIDAPQDAQAYGRWLFAQPGKFRWSVPDLAVLPEAGLPEVAVAGRSNVGKSTLLNALMGQDGLARASNTPGRTQTINFFELAQRLWLVDLPGYGFAKVPKAKARAWQDMMRAYLRGRPTLRRVVVLVDARRGLKDSDRDMMKMLDGAAVAYRIVFTKADKVKPDYLAELQAAAERDLPRHTAALPEVVITSAEKGWGLPWLRGDIAVLSSGSG